MKNKILIAKLSAIGDVVLSVPVAAALRERFPDAEISWLVGKAAAPLLENNPNIHHLMIIDETIFWRKRWIPLLRLFFKLRAERFDAVYILHWSQWFHGFFWLLGVPQRIGFARDGRAFRLTRSRPYQEAADSVHDVAQYLSLTECSSRLLPAIYFSPQERASLPLLIAEETLPENGPCIAIAPGGGHNAKLFMPQKRWPADHFSQLLSLLLAKEPQTTFLVLGDQSEQHLLREDLLAHPRVRLIAGRLSLRQTALLLSRCALFVGNDSGLLHVAGALRIPSVSLFGPTSPLGKLPEWTPHAALYTREVCSPCYKYGEAPPCPYGLRCLHKISPEQVIETIDQVLHRVAHAS